MNQQIKPSEWVILASGAVGFLLTLPFMTWWDFPEGFDGGYSAWSIDGGLFPLATFVPIIGLLLAAHIALTKFANVAFPPQVLGFTWTQIHLVLAVFAGLLVIGYLIAGQPEVMSGFGFGIGFWVALLATAGLITGAVMQLMEERQVGGPGAYPGQGQAPPSPF